MVSIEVRILKPDEYPIWNNLVETSPNGTVFHKSQWFSSFKNESQVETKIFGAFLQGYLVGGCVVHYRKVAGFFTVGTTTFPLTPYGGIILQPYSDKKIRRKEKDEWSIISNLLLEIQKRKAQFLSLTMSPHVIDIRPYVWQGWKESINYCYIFPLSVNIRERISKNVLQAYNKAIKTGINAKQKWDKELYWNLTLNTYQKQGTVPPFSKEFLFSLMDIIQENQWGEMWVAETSSGEVVAAEIIIWDNFMAYRWSAASHEQFKHTGSTSFLLIEIMTHLQALGYKKVNMMAANTPHLARFISSFNPELVPYYTVLKSRGLYTILNGVRSLIG